MIAAAERFGGSFDERDAIRVTCLLNRRDRRTLAVEMDEDNRFGQPALPRFAAQGLGQQRGIHIP